ncbi:MAG TPA: hypothetical protein VFJ70_16455 [Burkholderiales bacterium]|nr:hypothetical protein [Burkholderiales bacterium]
MLKRALLALLMSAMLGVPAQAQRVVIGVHFGVPLFWPAPYYALPPYYPPPYYVPYAYLPPAAALPPPAYPERESYYWYYCPSARAYYPYVRECPDGWQRVPTVPPG